MVSYCSWLGSYVQYNDMYMQLLYMNFVAMYYLKSLMLQHHSAAASDYFLDSFLSTEQQFIMCAYFLIQNSELVYTINCCQILRDWTILQD